MKNKLILTLLLILFLVSLAFAEIPIYCPKCKTLLYLYQKDEIIPNTTLYAKDFKPASDGILQPDETEPMVCPIDGVPLNGWEYWGKINKSKSHILIFQTVSLLTKDKDGEWLWIPYDVPGLNFNEGK